MKIALFALLFVLIYLSTGFVLGILREKVFRSTFDLRWVRGHGNDRYRRGYTTDSLIMKLIAFLFFPNTSGEAIRSKGCGEVGMMRGDTYLANWNSITKRPVSPGGMHYWIMLAFAWLLVVFFDAIWLITVFFAVIMPLALDMVAKNTKPIEHTIKKVCGIP